MTHLSNLNWTCHVCGDERPDDKISVHSTTKVTGAIEIKQNVRYCNDRVDCIEGAKQINWLDGPAHYEMTKVDGT
jgi:hypothetical protein